MAYWRLYYHIVFATKKRQPLISAACEETLYGYLAAKASGLGATVYAVNGIEDHVHVVASVPPKVALAEFVGQIKGASSHYLNHLPNRADELFDWERGYGVLSFGSKNLDWVVGYVKGQKEHHQEHRLASDMECTESEDQDAEAESATSERERSGQKASALSPTGRF